MDSCPWAFLEPGSISFCEERLCSWVAEPANTWSNIAYLILGLFIIRQRKKNNQPPFHFFAIVSIYLFFGSSAFHATGTFVGEVLDLSAMLLLSMVMLSINLKRKRNWSLKFAYLFFLLGFLLSITALFIRKDAGIPVFTVQIVGFLILEFILFKNKTEFINYKPFALGLLFFGIGFIAWVLDITKLVCIPSNHFFTGHSLWHMSVAVSIYYMYVFFDKFLTPQA